MAGVRWIGMGLLVFATTLGCGRSGLQEAPPAVVTSTFTPAVPAAPSATVVVWDEGRTLRLDVRGQGFAPATVYSIVPLATLRAGEPPAYIRADDALPEPLLVQENGEVRLITTFVMRGVAGDWAGFGIFRHPNGDRSDVVDAELVLYAPIPGETI